MATKQDEVSPAVALQNELRKRAQKISTATVPQQDRLTVVLNLSYEQRGEQAEQERYASDRFADAVAKQPYKRTTIEVTDEPQAIDVGWVENPGVIAIHNKTGRRLAAVPTPEEIAASRDATVVLERRNEAGEIIDNVAWIRSGLPYLGEIPDLKGITIRCPSGHAVVSLVVFPV